MNVNRSISPAIIFSLLFSGQGNYEFPTTCFHFIQHSRFLYSVLYSKLKTIISKDWQISVSARTPIPNKFANSKVQAWNIWEVPKVTLQYPQSIKGFGNIRIKLLIFPNIHHIAIWYSSWISYCLWRLLCYDNIMLLI